MPSRNVGGMLRPRPLQALLTMERELRNGDLVRVPAEYVAPTYEGYKPEGLLGVVIDDIDANEEVQIMYPGNMRTGWWNGGRALGCARSSGRRP